MRIIDRFAVLLRADAHGVLDRLEERRLLLKQHLREAELALDASRARLAALDDEARRVGEDADKLAERVEALDGDVELALSRGEEDLARFAVRRLLPQREVLAALRGRGQELARERHRLAERLAGEEASFAELRARVKARLAEEEHMSAGRSDVCPDVVRDEDVELELLRRREAAGSAGEA